MRPEPPVAKIVALAWKTTISPVSMSMAVTPSTSPSRSRTRSRACHSTKNWVLTLTLRWYIACSIACPVRSAAAQERRTGFSPKFDMWPPKGRW